ncbi:MAG: DUF2934 domain-containing protein [Candidatus Melainabacteria bacterium]|nr:DUF2934 domain-containing protein [Candidatus Melainabacteria bacterium]
MKGLYTNDKDAPQLDHDKSVRARSKVSVNQISELAYHAWLDRGCTHGFDVEDWLKAEGQLWSQELLMTDVQK